MEQLIPDMVHLFPGKPEAFSEIYQPCLFTRRSIFSPVSHQRPKFFVYLPFDGKANQFFFRTSQDEYIALLGPSSTNEKGLIFR